MTLAAITETPLKLAICIAALTMLVLSQLSMAHAMSAMGNGSSAECSEQSQMEHCSHHSVDSDLGKSIELDTPHPQNHGGGHDMSDGHCAISCATAYLVDETVHIPAYYASVRFFEMSSFPVSGTLQGLKRPPRI